MAIDFPAYGQQRASNELDHSRPCYGKKCMGLSRFGNLSKKTESIRSVHGPKRFSRINRIAGAGIRKRKLEKQVEGEIETEHPGYLDVKTRITWAQSKA